MDQKEGETMNARFLNDRRIKIVLIFLAVLMVLTIGIIIYDESLPDNESDSDGIDLRSETDQIQGDPLPEEMTRTVVLKASYAGYVPSEINAARGERLRIVVESLDPEPHGIAIRDLGLWGEEYVEFTVPIKASSISFRCAINCENPDGNYDSMLFRGVINVQ